MSKVRTSKEPRSTGTSVSHIINVEDFLRPVIRPGSSSFGTFVSDLVGHTLCYETDKTYRSSFSEQS